MSRLVCVGLYVAKSLSIMLGFGGKEPIIKKTTESPYAADLTVCDIVEPQIVGDTIAQLLESISTQGKFGDVIAETFTNIQYVPILKKSFQVVEVPLKSDAGDPVPFEPGKVVVTLHFRQHTYFTWRIIRTRIIIWNNKVVGCLCSEAVPGKWGTVKRVMV